ncbi:MAG: helix-turn-helix transcriptional regulator, partial [Pirellula sp.]
QAWYVIGHIDGENKAKTFRAARFKSLRQTQALAVRPKNFDLREYFGNAWSVYRGDQSYNVELLFDKSVSRTVVETHWHHTQKVIRNRDGSVTLKFLVDGLEEIEHWIMGWTGKVEVIQPSELRQSVVERLQNAIRKNS